MGWRKCHRYRPTVCWLLDWKHLRNISLQVPWANNLTQLIEWCCLIVPCVWKTCRFEGGVTDALYNPRVGEFYTAAGLRVKILQDDFCCLCGDGNHIGCWKLAMYLMYLDVFGWFGSWMKLLFWLVSMPPLYDFSFVYFCSWLLSLRTTSTVETLCLSRHACCFFTLCPLRLASRPWKRGMPIQDGMASVLVQHSLVVPDKTAREHTLSWTSYICRNPITSVLPTGVLFKVLRDITQDAVCFGEVLKAL